MKLYKPHFACFNCHKAFKRRLLSDIESQMDSEPKAAKCPQCGQLAADMGKDFEAPKKSDKKAWEHLERLYSVGITFHSCGCSGPGFIPNSKEQLIKHFESILQDYFAQLDFWRQRAEPTNNKELQKDKKDNFDYLIKIPSDMMPEMGAVLNEDAKIYWLDKIKQVEAQLAKLV